MEACIKLWVEAIPEEYRPRVQFQMLLHYSDPNYPDRPGTFKYALRFLMDTPKKNKNDKKEEQEVISVSELLLNVAQISLQCTSKEVQTVKEKIRVTISKVSPKFKKHIEDFLNELSTIILEIERPHPQIQPPRTPLPKVPVQPRPSFRNRPRSFWNFVPIIGSIKNIVEGVEDIRDGYSTSGYLSLAMGAGGIALDVFTLGTISTVVNSAGTAVAKEVGKEVAKAAGKTIAKEVGKEVVKEAGVATAKQVVSTVAMQTGGKVAATYGATQAARVLLRV